MGHKGIPVFVVILVAVVAAAAFVLRMTLFGRRVYAIGGNEQAARLSGVNVLKVRVTVFTVMTLLACLAGLLNAARSGGVSLGVTGMMAEHNLPRRRRRLGVGVARRRGGPSCVARQLDQSSALTGPRCRHPRAAGSPEDGSSPLCQSVRNSGPVARAATLFTLSLMVASCEHPAILVLAPDFESVILFSEDSSGGHAQAANRRSSPDEIALLEAPLGTVALLFQQSLASLGLIEGALEPAPGSEGRNLPTTDQIYLAASEDWVHLAELPASAQAFRFSELSVSECGERGGCRTAPDSTRCYLPCPAPPSPVPPSFGRWPDLPSFDPCPGGWVRTASGPIAWCHPAPVPDGGCPEGQLTLPSAGCVSLEEGCPIGGDLWAADLPAGSPTLYVRAGASGGSGTRADPFGLLSQALARATDGVVIALSSGLHVIGPGEVPTGVTLIGACPSQTKISGTLLSRGRVIVAKARIEASIEARGPSAVLELASGRVLLGGSADLRSSAGAQLHLTRMLVEGSGATLVASQARLDITSSTLRGASILGGLRAQVKAADVHIDGPGELIGCRDGCSIELAEVVTLGRGDGSALSLAAQSTATVRSLWVRSALRAVHTASSALSLTATHIASSSGAAVTVLASTATVSDIILRDIVASHAEDAAIVLVEARHVAVERAWVERVQGHAVLAIAARAASNIRISDLVVRDTQAPGIPGLNDSKSAILAAGGRLELRRTLLERVHEGGINLRSSDGERQKQVAVLEDVALVDSGNCALTVSGDAELTGERIDLRRATGGGVLVRADSAELRLKDLFVEGIREPSPGCSGGCCSAAGFATSGTRRAALGHQEVSRFLFANNARAGIAIGGDFDLTFRDGEVRGHPVGATVGPPAFSLDRLLLGVRYVDNGTVFQRSED